MGSKSTVGASGRELTSERVGGLVSKRAVLVVMPDTTQKERGSTAERSVDFSGSWVKGFWGPNPKGSITCSLRLVGHCGGVLRVVHGRGIGCGGGYRRRSFLGAAGALDLGEGDLVLLALPIRRWYVRHVSRPFEARDEFQFILKVCNKFLVLWVFMAIGGSMLWGDRSPALLWLVLANICIFSILGRWSARHLVL